MLPPWAGRKKSNTHIANVTALGWPKKKTTHIAKVVVKVVESGTVGFKIRNPLRGIQNSTLSWIPLHAYGSI